MFIICTKGMIKYLPLNILCSKVNVKCVAQELSHGEELTNVSIMCLYIGTHYKITKQWLNYIQHTIKAILNVFHNSSEQTTPYVKHRILFHWFSHPCGVNIFCKLAVKSYTTLTTPGAQPLVSKYHFLLKEPGFLG